MTSEPEPTGTTAPTSPAPDLLTASGAPAEPVGPEAALSDAELDAVVSTVKAEWRDAYPSADFSGLSARVADLPDLQLGSEGGGGITIDVDAAGWGWGSGGMSLKTAVRHELGHYLGLGHSSGLMGSTLSPGESWAVDASNLPKPEPEPAPSRSPPPSRHRSPRAPTPRRPRARRRTPRRRAQRLLRLTRRRRHDLQRPERLGPLHDR